jgi:glycerophosphoryl diester phosphodiesterase
MDELASERIDVLNVHHRLCRPWMPVEAMRRGVQLFAWGVRTSTALDRMVQCGVHGLYCDNLDRLLPRLNTLTQGSGP